MTPEQELKEVDSITREISQRKITISTGVTVGQLLIAVFLTSGVILAYYISTTIRLRTNEINYENLKSEKVNDKAETSSFRAELKKDIDELKAGQYQIQLTLQNKADRPK